MKKRKKEEKKQSKREAIEFMNKAEESFDRGEKEKANYYVRKARERAMNSNFRFPKEIKRKFCKHCYSFLKAGVNCRVRTREGKVVYYCMECKKYMRFVLPKR